MVVVASDDEATFATRILRAQLGPGEPWLDGAAAFLWQVMRFKEGSLSMDDYLEDWLDLYVEHRDSLSGAPHRQSALSAQVVGICQMPPQNHTSLRRREGADPPWMDQRGVLDVRVCLQRLGVELAAIRYEDSSPEHLLRVRSAPGDPPTVERGGSFFQAGDVIIEVNRRRIRSRGDVAWALRDVDAGERFIIVVQREGREARTWARRPRVRERDAVRFALIPSEAND